MFSEKNNDCVGFDSKWKVKRVFSEGSSQTTECTLTEIATNTAATADAQIQTAPETHSSGSNVNMQKLADWLAGVFPSMQKELNEAVNSKAFDGYYTFEKSSLPDAKLIQSVNISPGKDEAVRVSALSWNSTGNTIAISCAHHHKTWCHHSGKISFYTFDRNDRLPNVPFKVLPTSACVSILRFHLTLPYVLACGTYTGEIVIANIQHDEGAKVVTKLAGHDESITEMSWIHDLDNSKSLLLATSSLDGCLSLWSFILPSSLLVIKQKYKIKSPVLAKIKKSKKISQEIAKKVVRGVLSFDFSKYVPDMFVVGVEGGLIVQCSMLGTTALKGSTKDVPIADPVFKYYEPHEGEINTVRFSPNRQDMFLSTAFDTEVRIYMVGQDTPARVIFLEQSLNQACWVPYEEKLVAGCGEKGFIEIFHLLNGRPIPNVTSEKVVPTNLLQMDINKQRCTLVAVGNEKGELQLWNVPWGLFALQKLQ